jgi:hypothetical protein
MTLERARLGSEDTCCLESKSSVSISLLPIILRMEKPGLFSGLQKQGLSTIKKSDSIQLP